MNKLIVAILAGFAAISSAHAEGVYVGAGVASTRYKFDITDATSGAKTSIEERNTWGKVFGGYEFDKTWGIEAGYADFGNTSANYVLGARPGAIKIGGNLFYAAGKGSYALDQNFSLFGKVGLARSRADLTATGIAAGNSSATKTGLYFGGGLTYQLSKNAGLILELERFGKNAIGNSTADVVSATTASASVKFNF